jgi:hypothetical protein
MLTQRPGPAIRISLVGATILAACTQQGSAPSIQALGPRPYEVVSDDAGRERDGATVETGGDDMPSDPADDAVRAAAAEAQHGAQGLVEAVRAYWPAALEPLALGREGASVAEIESATGQPAGEVAFTWSARGFVTSAFAPLLRIPVDASAGVGPLARARAFLSAHSGLFGLEDPTRSLERVESRLAEGRTVFQFSQTANGLEVFDSAMLVHVQDGGDISWVLARVSADAAIPPNRPALTAALAREVAGLDEETFRGVEIAPTTLLGYYDPLLMGEQEGSVSLAWRVVTGSNVIYVDAIHGDVLREAALTEGDMHREILSCTGACGASDVPGALQWDDVCHREDPFTHFDYCTGALALQPLCQTSATCTSSSCDPSTVCQATTLDTSTVAARNGSGDFYNYLSGRHLREGWSGVTGSHMRVTTRADGWTGPADGLPDPALGSCDAQWNDASFGSSSNQVVLGSQRYCRDVVAHEFVHALDQVTSPMSGNFCSHTRAIEEAFGDVFGEYMERYVSGVTDWAHGTGCPACATARNSSLVNPASFAATCIWGNPASAGCGAYFDLQESVALPPQLPQPDSWSWYRPECGSYWNLTIASHIGWTMGREPAAGSATVHGLPVVGLGEADASHVWYRALVNDLAGSPTFTDLRNALILECTASTNFTNCALAVMSSGLWPGDSSLGLTVGNTSDFTSGAVDFASYPLPSPTRRYVFFQANNGDISYRFRTCSIGSTLCSWGSETQLEAGPMPLQRPSATTIPGGGVLVACLVQFSNGVYCDRWNGTSWTVGPDIGSSGISGSVSIAHFNGALYIAYRRSTGLYWRRVLDGASPYVWGSENLIVSGAMGTDGPVLASSDEDGAGTSGDEMYVAWRGGGGGSIPSGAIQYARFLTGSSSWTSTRSLSRYLNATLLPYYTMQPLSLSFYRGRLHLVTTEATLGATPATDALWYGSCAPPCAEPTATGSGDWTPFVRQEGTADASPLIDGWGPYDGWLHLTHQLGAAHLLYDRVRLSD